MFKEMNLNWNMCIQSCWIFGLTMHTVLPCKVSLYLWLCVLTIDFAYCCDLGLWKRIFHIKMVMMVIAHV